MDKRSSALANELGASLSSAVDLEMLQRRINQSEADLDVAKKTKTADVAACPKGES
jgi:hypothetical protein